MNEQEAIQVLSEVKAKHGRTYKQKIRACWMNGRYYDHDLEQWDCRLQQIRNQFGPSWLINARP